MTAAVAAVASRDQQRRRATDVLAQWTEPFLAGVTGLITVSSSRVPIDGVGGAAAAFGLGVVLLIAGKAIAKRVPAVRLDGVDA